MKMVSCVVSVVGVVSLVLAVVAKFMAHPIMGAAPAGLLRFATALFLLALVTMAYGRCYCTCEKTPPAAT
ncbi:MAG: hypothetical protein ACHQ4G_01735 [Opitutales bacterium]